MTLKGQTRDPNTFRVQFLENSWRCYLATIANYYLVCCEAVRSDILATAWLLVLIASSGSYRDAGGGIGTNIHTIRGVMRKFSELIIGLDSFFAAQIDLFKKLHAECKQNYLSDLLALPIRRSMLRIRSSSQLVACNGLCYVRSIVLQMQYWPTVELQYYAGPCYCELTRNGHNRPIGTMRFADCDLGLLLY